jgi:hypothetical protein
MEKIKNLVYKKNSHFLVAMVFFNFTYLFKFDFSRQVNRLKKLKFLLNIK